MGSAPSRRFDACNAGTVFGRLTQPIEPSIGEHRQPVPGSLAVLDQHLRPLKTAALAPAASRLGQMAPITVTAAGLAVGLAAAGLAAAGWWLAALVAWLLNRLLDGLDGELARATKQATDRGGYLDLVADATVYAAIPLGVAAGVGGGGAWTAAAFVLGAFYVNIVTVTLLAAIYEKRAVGAATRGEQTSVTLPAGLIEGTETVIFLAAILALPSLAVWLMGFLAAAVLLTAILRVARALPTLENRS